MIAAVFVMLVVSLVGGAAALKHQEAEHAVKMHYQKEHSKEVVNEKEKKAEYDKSKLYKI